MKITTQTTFELPDDILESILTIALESGSYGIGYWFCASDYKRDDESNIYWAEGVDAEIADEYSLKEYKQAHIKEHGKLWEITKETIEKGLKKAIRENDSTIMDALRSECPECQLDAADADKIVQYGLFGRLIYG